MNENTLNSAELDAITALRAAIEKALIPQGESKTYLAEMLIAFMGVHEKHIDPHWSGHDTPQSPLWSQLREIWIKEGMVPMARLKGVEAPEHWAQGVAICLETPISLQIPNEEKCREALEFIEKRRQHAAIIAEFKLALAAALALPTHEERQDAFDIAYATFAEPHERKPCTGRKGESRFYMELLAISITCGLRPIIEMAIKAEIPANLREVWAKAFYMAQKASPDTAASALQKCIDEAFALSGKEIQLAGLKDVFEVHLVPHRGEFLESTVLAAKMGEVWERAIARWGEKYGLDEAQARINSVHDLLVFASEMPPALPMSREELEEFHTWADERRAEQAA